MSEKKSEKKKGGPDTEPKDGITGMRSKRDALASRRPAEEPGEPDPERVKADPSTPSVLASGYIQDEMPGVTNPWETLDDKRTGAEAKEHLVSGPHEPEVTIIDGEPVKTNDTGNGA